MRARVHTVTCDHPGCSATAPGALHAATAIRSAGSAGWTRTRQYTPEGWYVRDFCPNHSTEER